MIPRIIPNARNFPDLGLGRCVVTGEPVSVAVRVLGGAVLGLWYGCGLGYLGC